MLATAFAAAVLSLALLASAHVSAGESTLPTAKGYQGIWYNIGLKYSGGMATYPQQHIPIAIYSPAANKTFFCYGGVSEEGGSLLHMVSFFDHNTGELARPRILLDKRTKDAHDNPTLSLDDDGHLYVFSNSHGTSRPSFISRSVAPYSIDTFQRVFTGNFSYSQPWRISGKGFIVLHTRYSKAGQRHLFWMTSADGQTWSEPHPLAAFQGHYQISWMTGGRVGTVFDFHPGGLDHRTNIYYLETPDQGQTWRAVDGHAVSTPLTSPANPALVHDYQKDGLLVYLKDLQFDSRGYPVILYLTSKGAEPTPANGPRVWRTARWDGSRWVIRRVTTSDHNYDHGSLYLEGNLWRIIAPTDPGPFPGDTGGEMVMWESRDQGETWRRTRTLTSHSPRNHSYARHPLNASPQFYTLWADGATRHPSQSHLYFANRNGDVYAMPDTMQRGHQKPHKLSP